MIGKLMVVYDPYFIIPFNQGNYAEKLCKNERERNILAHPDPICIVYKYVWIDRYVGIIMQIIIDSFNNNEMRSR